ncbi:MAG: hypothetical protein HYZ57_15765 [Acidobacteria bacterium]|nr:hypothetical protein [Acidobacteriota bacterium]
MSGILKSTPGRPVKFPPPGAGKKHKVSTGDNWWNLATKYGRTDAWEIIEFNFRTRDPRQVNWYLEFYVGCKAAAADGLNFRFDSADSPGIIYIPPSSWTPSEDLALRREVAWALSGPVVARLNVTHAGYFIRGTTLAAIANRVLDGEIGVIVDPKLSSGDAEYDSGTDTFHLGFRRASTTTRKGLVVHEAVHAALDMKAASSITVAESESLAYVVQSYYVREHTINPESVRLTSADPLKDKVYEIAWDMAAALAGGKQPTAVEWLALDHAVRRHPEYKKTAGNKAGFDGL